MAAGHVDPKTLDISEPQIIQHFPHDGGGFFWHHRILLQKCGPGIWIGLSPDGDLSRIDLNQVQHITLDRKGSFPAAQAPYVYAFDDLGRGELESYRRRAKVMNNLFNDQSLEQIDRYEWVVADLARADFGEAVKDDDIANGITMRDSGLADIDGDEVFVVRINADKKEEWLKQRDESKGDSRLLGYFTDGQGRRHLDFSDSLDLMTEPEFTDWPLTGPRVCLELLKSIRDGSSDLVTYHLQWSRNSGISQYSAALFEHRNICDCLKAFISTDQIDPTALLGCEYLCRRMVQIETAVGRNPASPDYSGLDIVMEGGLGPNGEARTTRFTEWISSKLKERAQIQKQARLFKEEFNKKRDTGDSGGGDLRGRGRGRGAGRGKGRARGSSDPPGGGQ